MSETPHEIFARLDQASRVRALTNAESLTLEAAQAVVMGTATVRQQARLGIKRDMSRFGH